MDKKVEKEKNKDGKMTEIRREKLLDVIPTKFYKGHILNLNKPKIEEVKEIKIEENTELKNNLQSFLKKLKRSNEKLLKDPKKKCIDDTDDVDISKAYIEFSLNLTEYNSDDESEFGNIIDVSQVPDI